MQTMSKRTEQEEDISTFFLHKKPKQQSTNSADPEKELYLNPPCTVAPVQHVSIPKDLNMVVAKKDPPKNSIEITAEQHTTVDTPRTPMVAIAEQQLHQNLSMQNQVQTTPEQWSRMETSRLAALAKQQLQHNFSIKQQMKITPEQPARMKKMAGSPCQAKISTELLCKTTDETHTWTVC